MMTAKKRQYRKKKRQLEEERRTEMTDNWDIVDTSENKPSDYWALREMQEEYCKEIYGPEYC